uniref:Uncharacterized protein n=2 Tax=Globodera rostochiensis TaxID=31243 RepID=A0A914GS69_GLORO
MILLLTQHHHLQQQQQLQREFVSMNFDDVNEDCANGTLSRTYSAWSIVYRQAAAEIGSSICSTSINIWYGQIVRYVVCNPGTVRAVDQAQKLINDLLAICLEMLCTRTKFFSMESQRTIIQIVLVPLIEKGAVDKMWRTSSKCRKRLPQAKSHFPSNNNIEQLIDYQQPNQGVLVLIKLFSAMEQLLFANAELQRHFMNATTRAAKKRKKTIHSRTLFFSHVFDIEVLISQPQLFFTVRDDETVRVWYLNNSNNIDHRQNTAAVHRTKILSAFCRTPSTPLPVCVALNSARLAHIWGQTEQFKNDLLRQQHVNKAGRRKSRRPS